MKSIKIFVLAIFLSFVAKAQIKIDLGMTRSEIIKDNKKVVSLKYGKETYKDGLYVISYLHDTLGQVNYYFKDIKSLCTIQVMTYPISRTPFLIGYFNDSMDAIGDDRWISKDRSFKCKMTLQKQLGIVRFVYRNIEDKID